MPLNYSNSIANVKQS